MTGYMINDDERYVSHSLHFTGSVTRETIRVTDVELVLSTLPEEMSSHLNILI